MISFFEKPIRDIGAADIEQLVAERFPETDGLEFKQDVPAKDGKKSPWAEGRDTVGDYGRDKILAEIIGMANVRGGYLILGIEETKDKPPRAKAINLIRDVGELAHRLEDQARTCIDPPIPRLDFHPVFSDGDAGLVVSYCGASRAAPHRLTTSKEAFVRRGTSTVAMTMREIQDMTLNTVRASAEIDRIFSDRQRIFEGWATNAAGIRVTAVPVGEIPNPGRLYGRTGFDAVLSDFLLVGSNDRIYLSVSSFKHRPILRGIETISTVGDLLTAIFDQFQNGVVDIRFRNTERKTAPDWREDAAYLYRGWILGAAATGLHLLNRLRKAADAPNAEYALEVQIVPHIPPSESRTFVRGFSSLAHDGSKPLTESIVLPRVSVAGAEEFDNAMNIVDVDIHDALGVSRSVPPFKVQWV